MKIIINKHTSDPLKFLITLKPNWLERNILLYSQGEVVVKRTGCKWFGTTEYITSDGIRVSSYIADEIDQFIKKQNW